VHSKGVPVSVFYKWLEIIISLRPGEDFADMALVPCQDPRRHALHLGPLRPQGAHLAQNVAETIAEGHYMLYQLDRGARTYAGFWPELTSNDFRRRSRTASQTCTPSVGATPSKPPRDTKTRIDVRMRDKCCLVTGQAAVKRARGGNFTGLEVAHIFPLMGVGDTAWTSDMSPAALQEVRTRQLADSPHNAILLRADIHSLFDDY